MSKLNIRAILYFSKCLSENHLGWFEKFDYRNKCDFKMAMSLQDTDVRYISNMDVDIFITYLAHFITKTMPKKNLTCLNTCNWIVTAVLENIGIVSYTAFVVKGKCLYPSGEYLSIELTEDYQHLEDDMRFCIKGAMYDAYYLYNQELASSQMGLGLEVLKATKPGFLNSISYNKKMLTEAITSDMLNGVSNNGYVSETKGISVRTILDYTRFLNNVTNDSFFPTFIKENIETPMIDFMSDIENNKLLYLTSKCHQSVIKNEIEDLEDTEQYNICFRVGFLFVIFCVTIDRNKKKLYNIVLDAKYKNLHNRALFGCYPLFREGESSKFKIDFNKFLKDLKNRPTLVKK